jgi:hypothetical protein
VTGGKQRFVIGPPWSDESLIAGLVAPGYAARIMGLPFHRLLDVAEREHVDSRMGFDVADLIALATKLTALERDAQQKEQLRAAVRIFRDMRDGHLSTIEPPDGPSRGAP